MSLHSLSRLYSRMRLLFVGLTLVGLLSACSPLDVVGGVLGGGPNVAANVQAGAENNQGVTFNTDAPETRVARGGQVDNIDQSQTTNIEADPLLLLLLIIGWLAPSPGEIARGIAKPFRRNKDG